MTLTAGIDLGGTKLAAGLVDLMSGEVTSRSERPTRPERGGGAVLADCAELARTLGAPRTGLGICEMVDLAGAPCSAATIDWLDLDLGRELGADVVICSDVVAAAAAEARFGVGAGLDSFLYVSIGTGISHCLVLGGIPWRGARGAAIVTGSPMIEEVAGGKALVGASESQRAGAAAELGRVLAGLVGALDPAALVVGGGLGLIADYRALWEPALRSGVWWPPTRDLPVLTASLGRDAGIVGAAVLAYLTA